MLPSESRVRRGEEFARAIRAGRRSGRACLVAYLAADGPEGSAVAIDEARTGQSARAGFVVSKAVGNAVIRNRVRRRLRHLVAPRLAGLPAGSVLVIRALPAAAEADSAALGRELDAALKRLTGGGGQGRARPQRAERVP